MVILFFSSKEFAVLLDINSVSLISQLYLKPASEEKITQEFKKSRVDLGNESGNVSGLHNSDFLNLMQNLIQPIAAVESSTEKSNPEESINTQRQSDTAVSREEKLSLEKSGEKSAIADSNSNPEKNEKKPDSGRTEKHLDKKLDEKAKSILAHAVNANPAQKPQKDEKTDNVNFAQENLKVINNTILQKKMESAKPTEMKNPLETLSKNTKTGDTTSPLHVETLNKNAVQSKNAQIEKLQNKNNQQAAINEKPAEAEGSNKTSKLKNKSIDGKSTNPVVDSEKLSHPVVSRETINLASSGSVEKKPDTVSGNNQYVNAYNTEKNQISSNLKSNLESDLSSNQQNSGFSMNHTERFNFLGKVDENPVLRQNLQQQLDQLLQRAKVIVRENGNAQLTTKLNPKELGEISIKLSLINGKLKGQFTVDSDFVQKELTSKLDKIFSELKTEGYVVDSFQVDVKSESGQSQQFKEALFKPAIKDVAGYDYNTTRLNTYMENQDLAARGEIYA